MEKRLNEIIARLSEINSEVVEKRNAIASANEESIVEIEERINALETELNTLTKEKTDIEARMKEAKEILEQGKGQPIEERGKKMEVLELRAKPEYRTGYFKALNNEELNAEERAAIVSTTAGLALPVATEKAIWDAIYEEHSILNDIKLYNTGTILEISVHTSITAGKAGKKVEGVTTTDEANTFVNVKLTGNDFSKLVRVSYAASKMTAGALEEYLISEISLGLGEALAEDVFAMLDAKTLAGNQVVAAAPKYNDLVSTMGKCKRVKSLTIYCSNESKYTKILGLVDTAGQPIFRDGVALGATVKVDAAAGDKIYIVDPQRIVGNMIQPVMIESDKDITNQTFIHAGYCRFESTLVDAASCAIIKKA